MSLKNVYCRAYQVCFAVGARLLPWRRPECITGLGSFARVPSLLAERGVRKPLIVASRRQSQTPAFQEMLGHLAGWSLYTGVTANPRVETVEAIAAQTGSSPWAAARRWTRPRPPRRSLPARGARSRSSGDF